MGIKILDAIQNIFREIFMDNIMSKISSLGNAGLIWIILTIIYYCLNELENMAIPVVYLS